MGKDRDHYMVARDRSGQRVDHNGRRGGERIRTGGAAFNGRELRLIIGIGLGLGIVLFEGTRGGFDFGLLASDPPAKAERAAAPGTIPDPFAAPSQPGTAPGDDPGAPAAAAPLLRGATVRPEAVRPIDGRSFALHGDRIRLADIDTPDMRAPCPHESALGLQAAQRLAVLLRAGPFQLGESFGRDADAEGRKLRIASRDGRSLGEAMIADGLARPWTGDSGPWCASGLGEL